METIQKKFLTVGETRAYFGSSRTFIYRLVKQGKLTIWKIGSRTYFKTTQIESLFQDAHLSN